SVGSVGTDNADYSVDVTSFDLQPGQSRDVEVTFTPATLGLIPASLTINSNDPDESPVIVELLGEGLDPPVISVDPGSFSDSLYTGETSSRTMTVYNSGNSDLWFDIEPEESGASGGYAVETRLSVPRSDGDFPRGTAPPSAGLAPRNGIPTSPPSNAPRVTVSDGSSFATESQTSSFVNFNLNVPEVLNSVAPAPDFIWLGDFGPDDNTFVYALNDFDQFMQIDTTTGVQTITGSLTAWGTESFSGMATDPTDGTMYLSSTNVSGSSLYILDPVAVTATRIGAVGFPGIIAIAVDDQGDMYGHDIVTDELVSIDKTTGAGTAIGSLGFDANFAQGMAFDPASGELLLAAFNNSVFEAELRIADRTTGATALVGVLGSTTPGGTAQLGWLGIPDSGVRWLLADPARATVPPGGSIEVTVTFDAGGLFGGDYNADLVVTSNDPLSPELSLPAQLHVTGAPDIWLSESALSFGQQFLGGTSVDSLIVKNVGTDVLVAGDVSTDHPDYSVDVTGFQLNPTEQQVIHVSFSPTTVSQIPATLSIHSDDPDSPVATVTLIGQGLEAPVISVTPASLEDSLYTGETSSHVLTIANTGGNDLDFSISTEIVDSLLAAVGGFGDAWSGRIADYDYVPVSPTGVWSGGSEAENTIGGAAAGDAYRFESAPAAATFNVLYFTDVSDVSGRVGEQAMVNLGLAFSGFVNDYTGFLDELGTGTWDVVLYESAASSRSIQPLVDYVAGGGRLISSYWAYDAVFAAGMEATYVSSLPAPLEVSRWRSHAVFSTPNQVPDLVPGPDDHWADNGDRFDPAGNAVALGGFTPAESAREAAIILGNQGRTILNGMIFEDYLPIDDDGDGVPDIVELVENELVFVGTGGWVAVDPAAGTVLPGSSTEVSVVFNAEGRVGGDYLADLVVGSNDPVTPQVHVPAHLNVVGAPDIALSASVLDYGTVFTGVPAVDTLRVENLGTEVLMVSDVSADLPDYAPDATSFSLAPGESRDLVVTFTPAAEGDRADTLTITSNDGDEPTVHVGLVGTGLNPPVIAVSPDSLSETLFTGHQSTTMLTIDNSGESELTYGIAIDNLGLQGAAAPAVSVSRDDLVRDMAAGRPSAPEGVAGNELGYVRPVEIGKGEEDTRVYPEMTGQSGGPDQYGYTWKDSNDPGGPAFDWIDAGSGTPLYFSDDNFITGIPLGFSFEYYGTSYTSVGAGSNGWLSFNGSNTWYPGTVPYADPYAGAIAPFARDLNPPAGGYVRYMTVGVAPYRLFVIEYYNIPDYLQSNFKTFEVILYEGSNAIRFQYLTAPNDPIGFGIESPDQTMGMGNGGLNDLFISPAVVESGYAIEFTLLPDWIVVDPVEGTVPAGESRTVAVTFDASGLLGGGYLADILVASNDPWHPLTTVPASLDVTGAPAVAVSDTLLDFGSRFIGTTSTQTIEVSNGGTDDLIVSDITSDIPDYSVDVSGFTLPPGGSQQVEVSFVPALAGSRDGTLTVASNDPGEPTVAIELLGEGLELPGIAVQPDSLAEDLFSGDTSIHTLTISNPGGSDLTFTLLANETTAPAVALAPSADDLGAKMGGTVVELSPATAKQDATRTTGEPLRSSADESPAVVTWLEPSPVEGTVPPAGSLDVSVTFDAAGLISGRYTADIEVQTNIPGHPGVVVPVKLDVTGAPNIAVSDTSLDFGTVYIGHPATKSILVSNNGTDVLTVSDI
ncbi:MAG: choice-of-anchor D domain-containing protein, partial [Candidatus Latescibacterota bacterium]